MGLLYNVLFLQVRSSKLFPYGFRGLLCLQANCYFEDLKNGHHSRTDMTANLFLQKTKKICYIGNRE